MEHLGTPFAWSIVAVLAIAVAAGMIGYGIYSFRKKDEPDPLYGGVSGTLKEDWTRTGNIDFHLAALENTSPQHFILRDRGRDGDCSPPPAQTRTGPIKASGSYLEYLTAKRALGQG